MRPEKELSSSQAPGSALPRDGFVWDGVMPSPREPASGAAKLTAAPQASVQEGMDGAARQAPGQLGGGASGSPALAASCSRPPSGIPLPRSEVTSRASFMLFTRAATRRGWSPEGRRLSGEGSSSGFCPRPSGCSHAFHELLSSHSSLPPGLSPSRGPALPAGARSLASSLTPRSCSPLGLRAGLGLQSPRSLWGGLI